MPTDLDIPFDRVTYRDRQLLAAQDLRDDQRYALRRNALHTRYLHETWGVALGFEVKRAEDAGRVSIGPGHAIDELGRDILLAKPVEVAVPRIADSGRLALTVGYQDDAVFRDRRELAAVCLSGGLSPRNERPAFTWRRPGEVQFGIEVPLASFVVEGGQVAEGPDLRVRRTTRPLVRPHIGWGETEAGRTGWHYGQDASSPDFGLFVNVDTSEAGFTRAPLYFAQLLGDFSSPSDAQNYAPFGRDAAVSLGGGLAFVARASDTGFTLRVDPHAGVDAQQAEENLWRVAWFGMEPVTGCEPSAEFDLARLIQLMSSFALVVGNFGWHLEA